MSDLEYERRGYEVNAGVPTTETTEADKKGASRKRSNQSGASLGNQSTLLFDDDDVYRSQKPNVSSSPPPEPHIGKRGTDADGRLVVRFYGRQIFLDELQDLRSLQPFNVLHLFAFLKEQEPRFACFGKAFRELWDRGSVNLCHSASVLKKINGYLQVLECRD